MGIMLGCLVLVSLFVERTFVFAAIRAHPPYEPEALEQDPNILSSSDLWKNLTPGLHGSFAGIDRRYDRRAVPLSKGSMSWSGVAWRGERLP